MVKNPPASAGDIRDTCSIPGSGRSLGEVNSSTLQYSCLGNSTDRGAWWATVHGVTKESEMTSWLNKRRGGITGIYTDSPCNPSITSSWMPNNSTDWEENICKEIYKVLQNSGYLI